MEYFTGFTASNESKTYDWNISHSIFSCTSSFASALIGMAIDKGYIKDVDVNIWDQRIEFGFCPYRRELQYFNCKPGNARHVHFTCLLFDKRSGACSRKCCRIEPKAYIWGRGTSGILKKFNGFALQFNPCEANVIVSKK